MPAERKVRLVLLIEGEKPGYWINCGATADEVLVYETAKMFSQSMYIFPRPKDPEEKRQNDARKNAVGKLVRQLREKLGEGDASHVK